MVPIRRRESLFSSVKSSLKFVNCGGGSLSSERVHAWIHLVPARILHCWCELIFWGRVCGAENPA